MNRFAIRAGAGVLLVATALATAPSLTAQEAPRPADPEARKTSVEVVVAPAPRAPRRLTFGFVLDPTTPPSVAHVLPGTPVDDAGIRRGDVLVRIAGETATIEGIQRIARATAPGDTVEIVLRRDGEERTLVVVPDAHAKVLVVDPDSIAERARWLVDKARAGIAPWSSDSFRYAIDSLVRSRVDSNGFGPEAFAWKMHEGDEAERVFVMPRMDRIAPLVEGFRFGRARLGLSITELNDGLAGYFPGADRGVLVLDVAPDSPAAEAGIEPGDVVVEVNGHEVWNGGSFQAAREEGDTELVVVRRGERREIRVVAKDADVR